MGREHKGEWEDMEDNLIQFELALNASARSTKVPKTTQEED